MNAKKNLVSFLAIATLLFLAAGVSAYTFDGSLVDNTNEAVVEINGIEVDSAESNISVLAEETISVKVYFTAKENASNVRIRAELEADKESVDAVTTSFDVEYGKRYVKTLNLKVPYELKDEKSDTVVLSLKVWNGNLKSETIEDIVLTVQRPSYNVDVKSIIVSSSLEAGQISPVDVVLRNTGYNDLEDVYVTVRIPELNIQRTAYFGDLVAEADDDENTVNGRIYLEVPYNVASGLYKLEVEIANEDFSNVVEKQVAVQNGFPEVAIKSGDNLLVLNPTNQLKVYKVVYPSEEVTVVVQAGSSKLVPIKVAEGEYNFDVFVFSGNELVGTINFSGTSDSEALASPVVVLTVILAIIFLVLLVVMIVLITKKPEKTEEFGESYY